MRNRHRNLAWMISLFCCSTAIANAQCVDPNTCFGTGALQSNTTGVNNSAFGFEALFSNTGLPVPVGEQNNSAFGFRALYSNHIGFENTGIGAEALRSNTSGNGNTAIGIQALFSNVGGGANTATGQRALFSNTEGQTNTATGAAALLSNTTGSDNTATGFVSLLANTTGSRNTANGVSALRTNETGNLNTAIGYRALQGNGSGNNNTATGDFALGSNSFGTDNTANGVNALAFSGGNANTGVGANALRSNGDGFYNTAVGVGALKHEQSGYRNVALGYHAGYAITTGSDNITIGGGTQGAAADSGVVRIGSSAYQKKTYVAGIRGVTTGLANATPVYIDGNGQLGTKKSSQETKEDILPIGSLSDRLLSLRPVAFKYKTEYEDGSQPIEFGLIAEEVEEVFPELVVYDQQGNPEAVRYDLLATLLVNELQKVRAGMNAQNSRIQAMESEIAKLTHK